MNLGQLNCFQVGRYTAVDQRNESLADPKIFNQRRIQFTSIQGVFLLSLTRLQDSHLSSHNVRSQD